MNATLRTALAVVGATLATQALAQITFYARPSYEGQSFTTERQVGNFERVGFNDRASSLIVTSGRWEVCEDARWAGRCVVVRPGQYANLQALGLNNSISSVRPVVRGARVEESRFAPAPVADYDYRARRGERLFEANVTSVRAVIGAGGQRCWIEREQIPVERRSLNVPGAVVGAVIGGILGHEIGDGRRVGTAGGAVAGGAIGANIGRSSGTELATRDVQRCASVPNQHPSYYDVIYNFRGTEHRVQMATPPGPTITVNGRGEPRASS